MYYYFFSPICLRKEIVVVVGGWEKYLAFWAIQLVLESTFYIYEVEVF